MHDLRAAPRGIVAASSPLWKRCDVVMHDPACSDFHDQEYVEDAERGRDDHKEIARYDALCMIPDEGHPTLLRIRRAPRAASVGQIFAYGARRDANSQLKTKFV